MKITPNDPKSVGQRIRNIRQILGDSMEQFAKKIDDKAKSGTVSNWETGKNLPNSKRLKRIAELGNVTVDYLLTGKSDIEIFSNSINQLFQSINNDTKKQLEILKDDKFTIEQSFFFSKARRITGHCLW